MPRRYRSSRTSRIHRQQQRREEIRNSTHRTVCVVSGCTLNVNRITLPPGIEFHTVIIPGGPFDLTEISTAFPKIEYKPNLFPGAVTKIVLNGKNIKTIFYSSGRVDIFGEITSDQISEVLSRFLAIMEMTLPYVDKPKEK